MSFSEYLLQFMKEQAYKPMTEGELLTALNIDPGEKDFLIKTLNSMEKQGLIVKNRRGRYGVPEKMNLIIGQLEGHPGGYGFLLPENPELDDIYVSREDMNGAMHGDMVLVRPKVPAKGSSKAEGEVVRILKRSLKTVVGTVERGKQYSFVVPDDKRIFYDLYVPKEKTNGAKNGQKVVAKIIEWPQKRRNPVGEIIEILGYPEEPGIDILSIIKKYDLPLDFPEKVQKQVQQIPDEVLDEDLVDREDFRNQKIITIDGEDAKDLDDAVSIEVTDGGYRLGVHIADVSYYVKEKSPLDIEALKRGCSVYLVDRVIPMLPPKLSNGICSLNPRVDRLTMSVIIDFDKEANIKSYKITPSVIKTCERMTYTQVNKILEDKDQEMINRFKYLLDDLTAMRELAEKLTQKRFARGSLDFDIEEAKVILDEEGHPVDVVKEERRIGNRIIEEFMIAANEVVAEHIFWLKIPLIYRIHEDPDDEKIRSLKEFLYGLGYTLKGTQNLKPKSLQQILEKAKGKPEQRLVNTMLLRSLKQARYSGMNSGHFGLASLYYTHFTSPIRRYPDLIVHRILRKQLNNEIDEKQEKKLSKMVEKVAKISSERERIAEEAERETVDLKIAEYMASKIGETYEAIVSGVTSFGIFVELDNTVEGLVHVSNMEDDYYHFNEKTMVLVGERTGRTFRIGDKVKVKVEHVNMAERQIDFVLV
ncbi:ribonuclease R [Tepidanaerobacter sp. GT38]|uniref:ribonuclease R n=1 Tax=Tepidanaerobacter sp. GT38 TaxID=2722793 RepID=UPI001F0104F2|nr:ribonuclease R [Tepidanaerobacter sp. GT38]MCG1013414.1 ribonuclease R [Tepidanaerobacter sp. GT38]